MNLILYNCSAGSGKTYTIVENYKIIVKKNIHAMDKILAITFTKKVAKEMKKRVVDSFDDDQKTFFLKNYDSISIQTIDSFIQKILKKYIEEKFKTENFEICLNQKEVIKDFFNFFFSQKLEDKIKNALIFFCQEKISKGKSYKFKDDLIDIFNSFLSQEILEEDLNLYQKKKEIEFTIEKFEKKISELTYNFFDKCKKFELSFEDFSYGKSGLWGFFEKLKDKKFEKPTKRVLDAKENIEFWIKKNDKKKEFLLEKIENHLKDDLEQICQIFSKDFFEYKSAKICKKNLYIKEILISLKDSFFSFLQEKKIFLLSENSRFFLKEFYKEDIDFFLQKIGLDYDHYFIDEFQDISKNQWNCFKQIIFQKTKSKISLLVGDVKQSIYRWRGSFWNLMQNELKLTFENLEIRNLDTNWRSSENLIKFNNIFFEKIHKIVYEKLIKEIEEIDDLEKKIFLRDYCKNILEIYSQVFQKKNEKEKEEKGFLEFNFIQDEKFNFEKAIDLFEDLQKQNFLPNEIFFLVRNNKESQELFDQIKKRSVSDLAKDYCNYNVISKGCLQIKKNQAIIFLINILEYFFVEKSDYFKYQIFFFLEKENFKCSFEEKLEEIEKKLDLPSLFFLNFLIKTFDFISTDYSIFIEQFFEIAENFFKKNLSFVDFLIFWKNSDEKFIEFENKDYCQIITVHQSKGLENKIVIMPFFDWSLDHEKFPIFWTKNTKKYFENFPINYCQDLKESDFIVDFFIEKINIHLDNLNLIYVALTRAKERFYLFSNFDFSKTDDCDKIKNVKDLLYFTLNSFQEDFSKLDNFQKKENYFSIGTESKNFEFEAKLKIKKEILNKDSCDKFVENNFFQKKENINRILSSKIGIEIHKILEKNFNDKKLNFDKLFNKYNFYEKNYFILKKFYDKYQNFYLENIETYEKELTEESFYFENQVIRIDKIFIYKDKILFLDFKTGKEKNHHNQINLYKRALETIFQKKVEFLIINFQI